MSIRYLVAYFYAGNGLVMSNQLESLQQAFFFLVDLFGWVGLRNNTWKMVSMACNPCHIPSKMPVMAYERLTTGTRPEYWEQQRMRVQCPEYGFEVTVGLLLTHYQSQHGMVPG